MSSTNGSPPGWTRTATSARTDGGPCTPARAAGLERAGPGNALGPFRLIPGRDLSQGRMPSLCGLAAGSGDLRPACRRKHAEDSSGKGVPLLPRPAGQATTEGTRRKPCGRTDHHQAGIWRSQRRASPRVTPESWNVDSLGSAEPHARGARPSGRGVLQGVCRVLGSGASGRCGVRRPARCGNAHAGPFFDSYSKKGPAPCNRCPPDPPTSPGPPASPVPPRRPVGVAADVPCRTSFVTRAARSTPWRRPRRAGRCSPLGRYSPSATLRR